MSDTSDPDAIEVKLTSYAHIERPYVAVIADTPCYDHNCQLLEGHPGLHRSERVDTWSDVATLQGFLVAQTQVGACSTEDGKLMLRIVDELVKKSMGGSSAGTSDDDAAQMQASIQPTGGNPASGGPGAGRK